MNDVLKNTTTASDDTESEGGNKVVALELAVQSAEGGRGGGGKGGGRERGGGRGGRVCVCVCMCVCVCLFACVGTTSKEPVVQTDCYPQD